MGFRPISNFSSSSSSKPGKFEDEDEDEDDLVSSSVAQRNIRTECRPPPLRAVDKVAAEVRSMDPRWGLIPEGMPTLPSASGAFDNSPQFQLRVRRPDAQFVPTGRLKFVVVLTLARLKSHWFSRPCGTGVVGHPPPAVETAGYCQCVPAGRNTTSR